MPSDSGGIYTLPPGYVAVTGTTIQVLQHNPIFEDIAAGLTARLMRSGAAPMTGPLTLYGDAALPDHAVRLSQVQNLIANGVTVLYSVLTNAISSTNSRLSIEQYAAQTNTGAYGLEIHTFQGANIGFVIHDYSNLVTGQPSVQIDKTNLGPILALSYATNAVTSPGTQGSGSYISYVGYGLTTPAVRTELGFFTDAMVFATTDPLLPFKHNGGLIVNSDVTNTRAALTVNNLNNQPAIQVNQLANTFSIYAVSTASFGPYFQTTTNGGNSLQVVKSGTGNGVVFSMLNYGTGNSIEVSDGTTTNLSITKAGKLSTSGQIATRRKGLVLVNGVNTDIDPGGASLLIITGPTAAFSIAGIRGGVDGERVTIINNSGQVPTIVHGGGGAGNITITSIGANVALAAGAAVAEFVYDGSNAVWDLANHN